MAIVEACTAQSADLNKVDVLAFEPSVHTSVYALRPLARPHSQLVRAFSECMRQTLMGMPGAIAPVGSRA